MSWFLLVTFYVSKVDVLAKSTFADSIARRLINSSPFFCLGRRRNRPLIFEIRIHCREQRLSGHGASLIKGIAPGNGLRNIPEGEHECPFFGAAVRFQR